MFTVSFLIHIKSFFLSKYVSSYGWGLRWCCGCLVHAGEGLAEHKYKYCLHVTIYIITLLSFKSDFPQSKRDTGLLRC